MDYMAIDTTDLDPEMVVEKMVSSLPMELKQKLALESSL